MHPLRLKRAPPLWVLTGPCLSGLNFKARDAVYALEVIGGSDSGRSAMVLHAEAGRPRDRASYVEVGSDLPASQPWLEAVVRGAVWLGMQLGAWVCAHACGDLSQAPSLGAVVSLNLWTSPRFAFLSHNDGMGDGPRVALELGVDGSVHVGFLRGRNGRGARRGRGVSLM